MKILEINFDNQGPAGTFFFSKDVSIDSEVKALFSGPDDCALVLHTSGTTSRPKIVPLTNNNICTSADNIKTSLQLKHTDRCLNIMPLFHIHGLIAGVLSSFNASASIYCTSGFNALNFFTLIESVKPTWFTAVPTMHQAILARAKNNRSIIQNFPLRFIRSSSSSLPPQVMKEMMEVFNCPIIEAYGMTEASHQMASNPITPGLQIPGSVGLPAGPELAIMSQHSKDLLSNDQIGEIVIKGSNIFSGYESNPLANEVSFTEGWFRTGDQGFIAENGYIHLTGRIKEIINRGGEKISPQEIDDMLLEHSSVQQSVTFAFPHSKLGEEIASAIVLRTNQSCTESEMKSFLLSKLARFKVPKKILFVEEIPKGATGKIQRIGLAKKLGLVNV